MPSNRRYSLYAGKLNYNFRTTIIAGACRSGKASISTLLASSKYVENVEEPWLLKIVPLVNSLKMIDAKISKELVLNYINEIMNDTILLRNTSFRPSDLSYVRYYKDSKEINKRLQKMKTRDDVQKYIKKNKPMLVLNLTEITSSLNFFLKTIPKFKVVYLIRNPLYVAHDCYIKGWFANKQLLKPKKSLPYIKFTKNKKIWFLPWWVKTGDENFFINLSHFSRCLYYWIQNEILAKKQLQDLIKQKKCKIIKFENLINNPKKIYNQLSKFLDIKPTNITRNILMDLKSRKKIKINFNQFDIDQNILKKMNYLQRLYF